MHTKWHSSKEAAHQYRKTQEFQVLSLGQEEPVEEETANHSSILAWKTPWREEPGRPQSTGLLRDTKCEHPFIFDIDMSLANSVCICFWSIMCLV